MWLRGGGTLALATSSTLATVGYIDIILATAGYIGYSWLLSPAEGSLVGVIQETH